MKRIGNVAMGVIVLAILWLAFVTVPAMKCESIAQAMGRSYIFEPTNGCYVQTVEGNWQRVDQPTNQYQP